MKNSSFERFSDQPIVCKVLYLFLTFRCKQALQRVICLGVLLGTQEMINAKYVEAQEEYLVVGERCPAFSLNDVQHSESKTLSTAGLRGKWVIFDFWNRYCSNCVAAFRENDSLRSLFGERIQFILVGYTGSQYSNTSDNLEIRVLYEQYRKRENLSLTVAYDSTLFRRFDIGGCPFIVVVDPNGIVRGLTYKIVAQNILDFLSGKAPHLPKVFRIHEKIGVNH